ncbi:MAG: glycosyltransferase family 4 protein [bacterium]|nr:MAG: glycosyltransferase family 4 protein [bacterium]
MRIGMILKARIPPPDIRVEKEAQTLIEAGHEVHLLLERGRGERREETADGIRFLRGVTMGLLREKWHRYTFSYTFRDPLWHGAIEAFVRDRGIEVLHVHDLPLVNEAVSVGAARGLPVVADLHENYPAGLQVWYTSELKKRTIYNYGRWSRYERSILQRVAAVVVVIEESKERITGLGIPPGKIYVVPNTASKKREEIPIDRTITDRYRDHFVISYIGGFAPHRGLDVTVQALPLLRERIPGIRLVLVGDRNEGYRRYLAQLASGLHCTDVLEMTGWQPFEKIWSYIEASDVCLVPHARNPHTDTTIPHKIFQYMMVGKPVVVSDCPPLRRVIDDSGGGLHFRYDDPRDLADKILSIHESENLRTRISQAGRAAFLDRYHWDHTSRELVQLYRDLKETMNGE